MPAHRSAGLFGRALDNAIDDCLMFRLNLAGMTLGLPEIPRAFHALTDRSQRMRHRGNEERVV
jgi:hypothetical protein